ncbi:MAG: hypothetical protein ACYDEO_28290 [Aggregatilineales bacterium]
MPSFDSSPPDSPLAAAILQTLLYADVFQFPMTDREIHHFLIGVAATPAQVQQTLSESRWLAARIECGGGYWALRIGRMNSVDIRAQRERVSSALWPMARRYGALLAHVPFVRMVGLTGALAMHNARSNDDDLDYLLVTTPGRVWLARALVVVIVRLARLRGIHLCPNYVLAQTALAQDQQNLYIAHEITQMIPLAGFEIYESLRAANKWTEELLPNARGPFYAELDVRPHGVGRRVQKIGEWLLSGPPGDRLEAWEHRRKLRKFASAAQTPHASALLDSDHVKGHFKDYGYPTLQQYQDRTREYILEP